GVAEREQDRLVLGTSPLKRLLAPGVPVHRVVGVLKEVGARLSGETVHLQHASSDRVAKPTDTPAKPACPPDGIASDASGPGLFWSAAQAPPWACRRGEGLVLWCGQ